ncbi:MAG: hypothetical protein WCX65_03720 [bacterium]
MSLLRTFRYNCITIIVATTLLISCVSFAGSLKTTEDGNSLSIENADSGLLLEINKTSGVYHISKGGKRFIGDGLVAMRINGRMLLNAGPDGAPSGEMKLNGVSTSAGADKTGAYKSAILKWETEGLRFDTEFRVYEEKTAVKFMQSFPDGYKAAKTAAFGDTSLNFPVFAPDDSGAGMNVFSYNYQIWPQALFGKNVKRALSNWTDGFIATPLFVFDQSGWTGALAPFSDFLIRFTRALDLSSRGFGHAVAVGLDGELQNLEPGRVTESIVVFSDKGVVDSMNSLGAAMLAESGKKPLEKNETFFLKYLGYWTDNGAYYYYRTAPGKNYSETLLALGDYLKKENIPARHIQLDSWWYYKSKIDNGVMLWEPVKEMFPDGLADFQKKLGLPLTFHNRYFAIDTPYKDRMPFIGNEGAKAAAESKSITPGSGPSAKDGLQPLTREVFDIWADSVKSWGGVMYEQDWLGTQISRVDALRGDPDLASNWMKNMNVAMAARGLDIQYCMPTILFYFESTRHQAVSNIRSSNDYYVRFHGRSVNLWWEHYYTSPLIAAVGAYPFKDVFITNPPDKTFADPLRARGYLASGDPNNKYDENAHLFEPYYRQEALLSILSAGPVGIGDRIGDINKPLVALMADEEGALVKPDRPLAPVERMFFKNPMAEKETLVGYTQSAVSGRTWHYVLGMHVNELLINNKMTFTLTNNDLPLSGDYVIYDFYGGSALRVGKEFSLKRGLRQTEFVYAVLAPVDARGRALIGDAGKFVTASSARIKSWTDGPNGMEIELNGPKNSATRLLIYSETAPSKVMSVSRNLAIGGKPASGAGEGWFEAGDNLYEIDLAGGAGEKVNIEF